MTETVVLLTHHPVPRRGNECIVLLLVVPFLI